MPTESSVKAPDATLATLQRGAWAPRPLQTSQGDFELACTPSQAASIERVVSPLLSQPYYLLPSHALV